MMKVTNKVKVYMAGNKIKDTFKQNNMRLEIVYCDFYEEESVAGLSIISSDTLNTHTTYFNKDGYFLLTWSPFRKNIESSVSKPYHKEHQKALKEIYKILKNSKEKYGTVPFPRPEGSN